LAVIPAIDLTILSAVNLVIISANISVIISVIIRAETPAEPTLNLADDLLDRRLFYTLERTCQTLIRPVDGAFRCARLA
jgi:hypothetical protein